MDKMLDSIRNITLLNEILLNLARKFKNVIELVTKQVLEQDLH